LEESEEEEWDENSGQATGDKEAEDIEDFAVVPHRTRSARKRRRLDDSDSEDSEIETQAVILETRRQSTRQRRAPNRLDL
jgi:hypothetical protein